MVDFETTARIEPSLEGFSLKIGDNTQDYIEITDKELVDLLSDQDILRIQELQQERLQPVGFDNAPQSAKDYREELVRKNDFERMKSLKKTISYNIDGTMNILPLQKTFCPKLDGEGGSYTHDEAVKLAEKKGYHLLSDYITEQEMVLSDRYQIIKCFMLPGETTSIEKGSAWEIFREMSGSNGFYWSATTYLSKEEEFALFWRLTRADFYRSSDKKGERNRVCGRKNME